MRSTVSQASSGSEPHAGSPEAVAVDGAALDGAVDGAAVDAGAGVGEGVVDTQLLNARQVSRTIGRFIGPYRCTRYDERHGKGQNSG